MSIYEVDAHEQDEVRYDDWRERMRSYDEPEEDAYELDDPKSPGFHERAADISDVREGK